MLAAPFAVAATPPQAERDPPTLGTRDRAPGLLRPIE